MEYLSSIKDVQLRELIVAGKIKINTKDDFELPITRSIPLKTRGKSSLAKFKIWLIDIQDEVFIEDYYFYMDWLPEKPVIKIPKGFVFNGASIPKALRNLFSPKGILYAASVYHDFGYQYFMLVTADNSSYLDRVDRKEYDNVFRKYNEEIYGLQIIAKVTWIAVRIFGYFGWCDYRKENAQIGDLLQS